MPLQDIAGVALIVLGGLLLLPALLDLLASLFGAASWFAYWPRGAKIGVCGIGVLALAVGLTFALFADTFQPLKALAADATTPTATVEAAEAPALARETPAEATATPLTIPTPIVLPTATPTPPPPPAPTDTPLPPPTPTPAPSPTVYAGPPGDCDPSIINAIMAANLAQARYMEGTLSAADLGQAWGGAAREAQVQAEKMKSYQRNGVRGVVNLSASWELLECRQAGFAGDQQVRVSTAERWTFTANIDCGAQGTVPSTWIDRYPAETYILLQTDLGWHITTWDIGPAEKQVRWRCP